MKLLKLSFLWGALLLSVAGFAATTNGTCGTNVAWSFDSDNKTLTISGTGAMTDYFNASSTPWYSQRANITTVIIEDEVTSISNYAFSECQALTALTIGSAVEIIGRNAFYQCSSLETCTIPASVKLIGQDVFDYCTKLQFLYFNATNCVAMGKSHSSAFSSCPDFFKLIIGPNVTNIPDDAFYGCSTLVSFTIPASVTNIGDRAFNGCVNLTSITIPNSITEIKSETFGGCTGLKTVNLPLNLQTISGSAFSGCTSLSSIAIPSTVTSIGALAFANCGSLSSLTIPNDVKSIEASTFAGCGNLASITIPSTLTSIGASAFANCNSFTSFTIPSAVTSIGATAFAGCNKLASFSVENGNTNYSSENGVLYNAAKTSLIYYPIAKPDTVFDFLKTVTDIQPNAFKGATSLVKVFIPCTIKTIGNNAFDGCTGLKQLTLNWKTPLSIANSNNIFANVTTKNCTLKVPAGTAQAYGDKLVWYTFNIEEYELSVEPTEETASFVWDKIENATGYTLVIYNDAARTSIFGSITFDAQGNVTASNGNLRAGSTQMSYTATNLSPETEYSYAIIAYDKDNVALESMDGNFTTLGSATNTKDAAQNSNINIYLANNSLSVQNAQGYAAQVSDIAGRIVCQKNMAVGQETINASSWSKGIYVVTLRNGNDIISQKVVKQ